MQAVHILDLSETGYIKPHVDNIKFSGDLLSGLCLLSPALMDLIHEETKETITAFLPPRCLYIMTPEGRFQVRVHVTALRLNRPSVCTRHPSRQLHMGRNGAQTRAAHLAHVS